LIVAIRRIQPIDTFAKFAPRGWTVRPEIRKRIMAKAQKRAAVKDSASPEFKRFWKVSKIEGIFR
jgi:hypothetical protein